MKAPAFQFYAQDFLTGVMYLTNEEKGIYITMLAKQWTDGRIPKKRLGFLVGIEWDNLSDELKAKFTDEGDFILNERLELEREKKARFIDKQRKNGALGGRPSKKEEKSKNPKETQPLTQKKPLEEEVEEEIENKSIKYNEITKIYNSVCKKLPQVKKLTAARKSSVKARIEEYNPEDVERFFLDFFTTIDNTPFLNGENKRGWTADFDWIMNPNNFIKIYEGKYNVKAVPAGEESATMQKMKKYE